MISRPLLSNTVSGHYRRRDVRLPDATAHDVVPRSSEPARRL